VTQENMAHTAAANGPLACQFDWGDGWLAATTDGESVSIIRDVFELLDLGYRHFTTERSSWANIKPQAIIDTILTPILDAGGSLSYVHQRMVGRTRLQQFGDKPLVSPKKGDPHWFFGIGVQYKQCDDAIDATVIHNLAQGQTHAWPTEVKVWSDAVIEARKTYIWWSKGKWSDPEFKSVWKSLPPDVRKHPACKKAIVAIAYLAARATSSRDEFESAIGCNMFGAANVFRANYERALFAAGKVGVSKTDYLRFVRQLGSRFARDMALSTADNGPSVRQP